jgi:DNA recombination protein RmuC
LKLSDGILCIDAKFPLENYRNWAQAIDLKEKKRYATAFRNDVGGHVAKIAGDYVKREAGTLPVAYAYLPSEAIFGYLVENEQELLRQAASQGVVVCSPSTILASLNLVWTTERAVQITQRAEQIEQNLRRLATSFEGFESEWDTLQRHIQNSYAKMQEAQTKYGDLKARFEATTRLEDQAVTSQGRDAPRVQ